MVATYTAYALQVMKYGLSNIGKHLSCRSVGNTMGEYMQYIIYRIAGNIGDL